MFFGTNHTRTRTDLNTQVLVILKKSFFFKKKKRFVDYMIDLKLIELKKIMN